MLDPSAAPKPNPLHPPHPLPEGAKPTRVPMRYLPQLSLAERDRRWDQLRKRMLLARIDALVFLGNDIYWDMGIANIRYVFHVASKIALYGAFFIDRPPVVWNSVAHMNRPFNFLHSTQEWVSDIRAFRGLGEIAAELGAAGLGRSRLGLVGYSSTIQTVPTLLHGEVEELKKMLPGAELVDASWILEQMRLVKSEEEIGMLRQAGQIARQVIDAMIAKARPGVTEAELFAEMIRTQIANGGEPNIFNLLASGPVDHPPTELWHLLHGLDQPQVPSMRPLADNDIVVAEWHTKYGGYLAHTEYTVYVGKKAPQPLKDIFKVCVESLDVSKEVLRAGNTLREAWEAIRAPCRRAGYDFVELGFHAMGLGSPEFPTVIYLPGYGSNALNGHRIGDFVLEEGMTFGNNLDIFDPKWKPDVGCMYSDFMVVRKGGAECLVNTPRELAETG
jgi:Xaa-Pro aminopeptidase